MSSYRGILSSKKQHCLIYPDTAGLQKGNKVFHITHWIKLTLLMFTSWTWISNLSQRRVGEKKKTDPVYINFHKEGTRTSDPCG